MRLYHLASREAVPGLLANGFAGAGPRHRGGVRLIDDPLAAAAITGSPSAIVEVLLDTTRDEALTEFEVVDEGLEGAPIIGVNFREWVVDFEWLRVHVVGMQLVEDREALYAALAAERKPIPARMPR
jgi:hypothetical protein